MGEVVKLEREKSSPEYCWECACGCQQFILLINGDVLCPDCNYIQTRIQSFDTRTKGTQC